MSNPDKDDNGAFPQGWRIVRLGDVAEVAFSGVDKRIVPEETPVLLCNYTDVFYNERITPDMDFMTATATDTERERWQLKRGDVLFTKDSETADEIGIPSVVTDNMPGVLCGYHLGVARPSPALVDGPFLAAALNSTTSRRHFTRVANGVTRFGLTLEAARSVPVLLPPMPEQRAIADVLDSIDEAIERTEAVIAATETLRDSLLHELLTRGVPGWHTEWKDVPGIGTIPVDWEVVRLGDVATVNPKRPPLDVLPETTVTFLPMSSVGEDRGGIKEREIRPFRDVAKGYTYFEQNDILFAKITPCLQNGKHALAAEIDGPFGFGTTEFHVVRAGTKLEHRFLFQSLTRPENIERCIRSFSGTAGQQRIQPEVLRALSMFCPPLPEQRAIADSLDGLDNTIEMARTERERLKSLQSSIADELMTGRRRVD